MVLFFAFLILFMVYVGVSDMEGEQKSFSFVICGIIILYIIIFKMILKG